MNIFNFIKSKLSILEVVREYSALKKAGSYWIGRCPFHHEKTGSFSVSPHKEIFYCFGCHQGGDIITFISKLENCTQLQAAKMLLDRFGITLPESINFKTEQDTDLKEQYHKTCETFAKWCHQNIFNSTAYQYLASRKITEESIKQFGIGYFNSGAAAINSLLNFAQKHGVLAKDFIDANILYENRSIQSKPLYSPFEDRIIFPIKDHLSRFCGFGGRVFLSGDERAKYYNSHDHKYFSKGNILYGLDTSKKKIQNDDVVYLVEGYMDAIAMVQNGFFNTVASLGTACTNGQLQILSRYAHKIFLVYDGDKAGKAGILRFSTICWDFNVDPYVLSLPIGEDPASIFEKNLNFKDLDSKAQDIFSYITDDLSKNFGNQGLSEKILAVKQLLSNISSLQDRLKQEILIADLSAKLGISTNVLRGELSTAKPTVLVDSKKKSVNFEVEKNILENKLICAIINKDGQISMADADYLNNNLTLENSDLLRRYLSYLANSEDRNFNIFFEQASELEKNLISKIIFLDVPKEDYYILFEQFKKRIWKNTIEKLKNSITDDNQKNIKTDKYKELLSNLAFIKKS